MKIQQDKIKHFCVSAAISIFICSVVSMFTPVYVAVLTSAAFTLGVGMGKEYGDSVWDWLDMLADVLGMITGILVYYGVYKLIMLFLISKC